MKITGDWPGEVLEIVMIQMHFQLTIAKLRLTFSVLTYPMSSSKSTLFFLIQPENKVSQHSTMDFTMPVYWESVEISTKVFFLFLAGFRNL